MLYLSICIYAQHECKYLPINNSIIKTENKRALNARPVFVHPPALIYENPHTHTHTDFVFIKYLKHVHPRICEGHSL